MMRVMWDLSATQMQTNTCTNTQNIKLKEPKAKTTQKKNIINIHSKYQEKPHFKQIITAAASLEPI